jgi:hypothetical protein
MPQDLVCRKCDYTMTLGAYHYHGPKNGYWSRTAFACGGCGTTHYVEHSHDASLKDRYVYHHKRSSLWVERNASMPPGEPTFSTTEFSGFEGFVCPVCQRQGNVITIESLKAKPANCPLCNDPLEELGFWMT